MNILIYGAGVVGSTYGWQFSRIGHHVSVLVRPTKKSEIEKKGISMDCTDFRGGEKRVEELVFLPEVVEEIPVDHNFDYLLVTVNCMQLREILPHLSERAGKAQIVFFHNNWNNYEIIARYLFPQQYFFGFPFMVGGGRSGEKISATISGLKYSHTLLGEVDGSVSERVQQLASALEAANLKPMISADILNWLITHYAVAAALSGGVLKAGGGKAFAKNNTVLKETIKAIREGLQVCEKRGINPKQEKSNRLYFLPLFLGIRIARKIYSDEGLCRMFDGHTRHAPDEMKQMLTDLLTDGEKYGIDMPYMRSLKERLEK